jgi:ribonucleoside-diphosphate reductase alpha chain
MDESAVKATIAGLIAKVETLQAANAELSTKNAACAQTVARLVSKVEGLQAQLAEQRVETPHHMQYRKRPPVMRGRTVQSNVGCGPLYITLNEDEAGRPFEVFFKLGKSGSCQQSYLEAIGVAISVGLRCGADPQKFVEKFEGMRCPNPKMRDAEGPTTLSCADGISQGLAKALALALPIADVNPRGEAHVVSVAEPQVQLGPEDKLELDANTKSLDLIPHLTGNGNGNGNGHSNGGGALPTLATLTTLPSPNVRKAMLSGVGMCPKCGGNLISQGGCIQCIQQCGYVGKCS